MNREWTPLRQAQRTVLAQVRDRRARVVLRRRLASDRTLLSLVRWEGSGFEPIATIDGDNLEALGFDRSGRLLLRSTHRAGQSSRIRVAHGSATRQSTTRLGCSPGPVVVVRPDGSREPTIIVQGRAEELVMFHPPQPALRVPRAGLGPAAPPKDRRGTPRSENPTSRSPGALSEQVPQPPVAITRLAGRGQSTTWPQTHGPVVADLAGDGRRQLLLATAAPSGCARLTARQLSGREVWHHDFTHIPGTAPVWNTGGLILWQTGRFTNPTRQDVLVTVRRSMMHSEETVLLSGRDGRELWRRDRQISHRGVGGTPFAIADWDGDGLDDAASLHPSILYLLKGSTGRDILAKDAAWKGVPSNPVYWGQPAAGDFLNTGRPALFFGGRSMTGLLGRDGSLVWWDALAKSPADLPAFGDFDGDGRLDALGVGYEDGVRCYDAASGNVKWRMPKPADDAVAGAASADLDGDGRDEALFSLGRALVCIGASRAGTAGELRWRLEFPAPIGPPTIAALSADGRAAICVVGSDGYVYGVR